MQQVKSRAHTKQSCSCAPTARGLVGRARPGGGWGPHQMPAPRRRNLRRRGKHPGMDIHPAQINPAGRTSGYVKVCRLCELSIRYTTWGGGVGAEDDSAQPHDARERPGRATVGGGRLSKPGLSWPCCALCCGRGARARTGDVLTAAVVIALPWPCSLKSMTRCGAQGTQHHHTAARQQEPTALRAAPWPPRSGLPSP